MLSSNSSGFEKDLTDTRVYQFEDPALGQSSVQFVQSLDEFDLEQSCLLRLKLQRQKIEELTKLYQNNEKELALRSEKEKKLQAEVEKLSDLQEYKQSYIELKKEYQIILKKEQVTSQQFECLRKEFDEAIAGAQLQSEKLKSQIKMHKEQRLLVESHWEAIVADRDQQLKKQMRAAQQRQAQLIDKLNKLDEQLQNYRQSLCQKASQLDNTSSELVDQIKAKDQEINNYDKLTECMRRQLSDFRNKMLSSEAEWDREKLQMMEMMDQLKIQLRVLRKDQSEKQNQIYEYKQMIKRCDNKNQTLQESVNTLKNNLKKVKGNMDTSIKKLATNSQEEKMKLDMLVQELKGQLERQMEQKNMLALEIKRLRSCIQRKQQQEKHRKLLLMSEFREIDKMQKVVKRVI